MGHYKGWTAAALVFGVSEVVLELLMPMLMSAIVDGGLYREDTFMLQGWFSPELIANRNRFVLTVGAIMVGVACLSMAMGVLADMGTHQELLSRSPIYRDVYESQMREGAVDDAAC